MSGASIIADLISQDGPRFSANYAISARFLMAIPAVGCLLPISLLTFLHTYMTVHDSTSRRLEELRFSDTRHLSTHRLVPPSPLSVIRLAFVEDDRSGNIWSETPQGRYVRM